jgi:hypothetical protein
MPFVREPYGIIAYLEEGSPVREDGYQSLLAIFTTVMTRYFK